MPRYLVPIYFMAETEVEADTPEDAIAMAGEDDDQFEMTSQYLFKPGGPPVCCDHIGTPIQILGDSK